MVRVPLYQQPVNLVKRGIVAVTSLLFTRRRVNLRDIAGFKAVAHETPAGVTLQVSGELLESSKGVVDVTATLLSNSVEISVIARGIVVSGPQNEGKFEKTISLSLQRHGTYKLTFKNRDGQTALVSLFTW